MDTEIKNFLRRFKRKFGKAVGLGSSGLQKFLSSLKEVEIFSYSGYSCLRVIQWPCGSALVVGLV